MEHQRLARLEGLETKKEEGPQLSTCWRSNNRQPKSGSRSITADNGHTRSEAPRVTAKTSSNVLTPTFHRVNEDATSSCNNSHAYAFLSIVKKDLH